jgi:hypothetical protein
LFLAPGLSIGSQLTIGVLRTVALGSTTSYCAAFRKWCGHRRRGDQSLQDSDLDRELDVFLADAASGMNGMSAKVRWRKYSASLLDIRLSEYFVNKLL